MSDNSNQIDSLTVGIGLDSSDFKRGQQEIGSGLDQIEKSADGAASSVDNLGDKAGETGKDLSGLGGKSSEASQGVESLGQSAESTAENVEGLGSTAGGATTNVDNLGGTAENAADSVEELGEASQAAADKIQELQDQINELQEDAENASDEIAELQDELDNLNQTGSKTGKSLGSHFDQVTRSLRGLSNELLGVLALSKGGSFLGGQITDSINGQADTGRQATNLGMKPRDLQAWESVSELYGGSADEARQSIGGIRQSVYDNIYKGAEVPQWARMLNIRLDNGHRGMRDIEGIIADMYDKLKNLAPDDQSYVSQQLIGLSPSFANMSRDGGESLHRQLSAARDRSGLTSDGIANTQQFQRESKIAIQELSGAWNKFIGENAPRLTEALNGITSEFSKFGQELSRNIEDFNKFKNKHASAASTADQIGDYAGTTFLKIITGKSDDEAAALNKRINELFTGKKQSPDGILYDPKSLPGGPSDDEWSKLWSMQQRTIEGNIKDRDSGRMPAAWADNDDRREYQERVWNQHQVRADWEAEKSKEIEEKGYKAVFPDKHQGGLTSPQEKFLQPRTQKLPPLVNMMQDRLAQLEKDRGLPAGLLTKVMMKESGGDVNAVSYRNGKPIAYGPFQFTPDTAKQYSLKNPHNPIESSRAAADFYKNLAGKFGGDIDKMMASYNSGPNLVERLGATLGDRWRDGLGPDGQGYINYEQLPGVNKLLKHVAKNSKLRADRALMAFPVDGGAPDYSQFQVPMQLQAQTSPAMSPGVQQAMSNDNRTVTSTATTHIDNVSVHVPGGNSEEIANGIGSALQSNPLINGANYA